MRSGYKLTDEQAFEALCLRGTLKMKDVAHRFGVSRSLISAIWAGWARPDVFARWKQEGALAKAEAPPARVSDRYVRSVAETLSSAPNLSNRGSNWAEKGYLNNEQKEAVAVVPQLLVELLELRKRCGKEVGH